MHDVRTVLEAGGLVPPDAAVPEDLVAEPVAARVYAHPAIALRTVVRLVPSSLGVGSDTHLGLFGFVPQGSRDGLALQRRRELGFPQWTLVHEPAHAELVLAQLPAFRRARKLTASKPGHARDAFAELAGTFEQRAPSVLPTFWEEAGRAFVDQGNPKMAASCFDKARAAEASFGLPADGARLAEVFLEFALAGAVTVKSLQAWARDLSRSVGADEAYERFFSLAVRRTLGGLPPWASFGKDLGQLAKAAGRDLQAERLRWTAELLGAAALDRATPAFWREHVDVLATLARRDPAVARSLLQRLPRGGASSWGSVDEAFADTWIEALHEAGVLARAWSDPEVDASTWLGRLLAWAPDAWGPALPLARRIGERLAAEGRAFVVEEGGRCDVDVLDLLLELGVELRVHEDTWWDVGDWAGGRPVPPRFGLPEERRPRDPAHLAAHPELGRALLDAAADQVGNEAFEQATASSPVMADVRRRALLASVARLDGRGLRDAEEVVDQLVELSLQRLRDEPEVWEGLRAADLARALAASWRSGLLDELGWPAFEEAVRELGTHGLVVNGPWPWTVLFTARRAVVLGPDGGRVTALDLHLPGGAEPTSVRWIGEQLLVGWREGGEGRALWSGRPRSPFPAEVPWSWQEEAVAAPLPDGSWFLGGRPFREGEEAWPEEATFLHDGHGFWRLERGAFAAIDPRTGSPVPGAPEPSFAAGVPEDDRDAVVLRTAPGGVPFGRRPLEGGGAETLSGLVWRGDEAPDLVLELPGDGAARAVVGGWSELELYGPEGWVSDAADDDDDAPRPSLDRWSCLVPRDPAGSAALRRADPTRARAVMEAVRGAADPAEALSRAFPEITDPRLRASVGRGASRALEAEEKLRSFLAGEGTAAVAAAPGAVTPEALAEAAGLAGPGRAWADDVDVVAAMTAQAAFFAGSDVAVPPVTFDWASMGSTVRALGWVLARPGLTEEERSQVLPFLEAWLGVAPLELRRATWSFVDLSSPFLRTHLEGGERHLRDAWTVVEDGGRWLATTDDTWSDEGPFDVATLSTSGGTPPGATLGSSVTIRVSTEADRAWVEAMLVRARSTERASFPAGAVDALATATGLLPAAAAILLAGGPRFDSWEADFLGSELRGVLGLKRSDASLGRSELQRLDRDGLRAVLAEGAPHDPAALWSEDPGEVVRSLADTFVGRFGTRVAVPPEVRASAEKALGDDAALDLLAAPDATAALTTDRRYGLDDWGEVEVDEGEGEGVDVELLRRAVLVVPWAMQQVPAGDPLLANARRLVQLLKARLAAPGLLLAAGSAYASNERKANALFLALGGELTTGAADETWRTRDTGGLVVRQDEEQLSVVVRVARLDDDALEALGRLGASLDDPDLTAARHVLAVVRSGRLDACVERISRTPVPPGGHECDPTRSAPELHAAARAELGLDAAAAALLLQTLALPSPTKKAVCGWNGWSGKVYAAAAGSLVSAGLLVEAKRARSGREHFLPGPWVDGPLPYERWKVPLFGGRERKGELELPLGPLAVDPPHVLFELAWRRWTEGDRPAFG